MGKTVAPFIPGQVIYGQAYTVAVDNLDNVYVAGGDAPAFVAKLDSDGNTLWTLVLYRQ